MNRLCITLAILLVAITALQAQARPQIRFDKASETCRTIGDGPLEWESRAWGEGGKQFKQVCQSCHSRSNDKGAPFLWSESKTSRGWNRVFYKKSAKCAKDGSWDVLSQEQKRMVNDYLYRWAANSQDLNDNC